MLPPPPTDPQNAPEPIPAIFAKWKWTLMMTDWQSALAQAAQWTHSILDIPIQATRKTGRLKEAQAQALTRESVPFITSYLQVCVTIGVEFGVAEQQPEPQGPARQPPQRASELLTLAHTTFLEPYVEYMVRTCLPGVPPDIHERARQALLEGVSPIAIEAYALGSSGGPTLKRLSRDAGWPR